MGNSQDRLNESYYKSCCHAYLGNIKFALDSGADINYCHKGVSMANVIFFRNRFSENTYECLKFLLERGINVENITLPLSSGLGALSEEKWMSLCYQALIDKGKILHLCITQLLWLINSAKTETIKNLLSPPGTEFKLSQKDKYLLMESLAEKRPELLQDFLERGLYPSLKCYISTSNEGFLTLLSKEERKNELAILLKHYSNIYENVSWRLTKIIDRTKELNIQFTFDSELFVNHALHKNYSVASIMLEYKANIDVKINNDTTTLIQASQNNDYNTVRYLLENKADPNSETNMGRNALLYAGINNNIEMIQILLEYGATYRKPVDNKAFFTYVEKGNYTKTVEMMKKKADLSFRVNNKTPIQIAIENGHHEIVKLLADVMSGKVKVEDIDELKDNNETKDTIEEDVEEEKENQDSESEEEDEGVSNTTIAPSAPITNNSVKTEIVEGVISS